jgi:hypothetical protein
MEKEFIIESGVKFKRKLQLNMRRESGAKNHKEYVEYLKKIFNITPENDIIRKQYADSVIKRT